MGSAAPSPTAQAAALEVRTDVEIATGNDAPSCTGDATVEALVSEPRAAMVDEGVAMEVMDTAQPAEMEPFKSQLEVLPAVGTVEDAAVKSAEEGGSASSLAEEVGEGVGLGEVEAQNGSAAAVVPEQGARGQAPSVAGIGPADSVAASGAGQEEAPPAEVEGRVAHTLPADAPPTSVKGDKPAEGPTPPAIGVADSGRGVAAGQAEAVRGTSDQGQGARPSGDGNELSEQADAAGDNLAVPPVAEAHTDGKAQKAKQGGASGARNAGNVPRERRDETMRDSRHVCHFGRRLGALTVALT